MRRVLRRNASCNDDSSHCSIRPIDRFGRLSGCPRTIARQCLSENRKLVYSARSARFGIAAERGGGKDAQPNMGQAFESPDNGEIADFAGSADQ